MSASYASRLSEYHNKGVVGLPENYDSKRARSMKLRRLAEWVSESKHFVVITGAGISTSAGIPDFRGPRGIWTMEKLAKKEKKKSAKSESGKKRKRQSGGGALEPAETTSDESQNIEKMDFATAKPTLTHRAIAKLACLGKIKYCVTQNVDGLHRRSGLSRDHHAPLHGCAFTEKCDSCHTEYFRDEDVGGMSFQPTGGKCEDCDGNLHDTLLDWEDPLPEKDLERAENECQKADLILCLGTSLRIEPVGSFPLRAKRFVIVNLQETPKDKDAAMLLRARVDDVMVYLMDALGYSGWDKEEAPMVQRRWVLKSS